MKRNILGFFTIMMMVFMGCTNPETPASDSVVSLLAIPGVVAPVCGASPVAKSIDTAQYSGTLTWSPVASSFAPSTVYTATIALTAKSGWTLSGVAANCFTVAGATATNAANGGTITAVFPATGITESTLIIGAWRNPAKTKYVKLNADGTAETQSFSGTWTASSGRIVFRSSSETIEENYLLADGKLYRDPDIYIFTRTTVGTSIVGTFERIKQATDKSWKKEVFSINNNTKYTSYSNTPADYNSTTGIGTWVALGTLTGTVEVLPADDPVGGKVCAIDVKNVTPVTAEFPSKAYQCVFWTTNRLSVDCEGYDKYTP